MDLLDSITGKFKGDTSDQPFMEIDEAIDKAREGSTGSIDTSETTFEVEVPETKIQEPEQITYEPTTYSEREDLRKYTIPEKEVASEISPVEEPLYTEILPEYHPGEKVVDIEKLGEFPATSDISKKKEELQERELEKLPTTPEIKDEEKVEEKAEEKVEEKAEEIKSTDDTLAPESKTSKQSAFDRLKKNLFGTNGRDSDYARRGGYIGKDPDTLEREKIELQEDITSYEKRIKDIKEDIIDKQVEYEVLKNKKDKTADDIRKMKKLEAQIESLKDEQRKYATKISEKRDEIRRKNESISKYKEAVLRGMEKSKSEPSRIGKKLQKLGEGAADVSAGVYGGTKVGPPMLKTTWFGQKGFLALPFKEKRIGMEGVIQPVHGGASRLGGYTRMTGQSVRGGIGEALVTVKPSRMITPYGVPTGAPGVTKVFAHTVPARQIPLSDINKAAINPAILPSIYDVKQPQVVQPPIQENIESAQRPVLYRKHKPTIISVNRFSLQRFKEPSHNSSQFGISHGPKITPDTKRDKMISRGVSSVGNVKVMNVIDTATLGSKRTLKSVTIGNRPSISLGLISPSQTGMYLHLPKDSEAASVVKIQERKSKKSIMNVDMTISNRISKNINNVISKRKKK